MDDPLSKSVARFNRRKVLLGTAALSVSALTAPLEGWANSASASDDAHGSGPVATTVFGRIRGYRDGAANVFKGVPYGASTAGENRWLAPRPPLPWRGIKNTVSPGPMAPQNRAAPLPEEQAMSQLGPKSEDCLNLNVFTPAIGPRSGKRPVIVWYHGGAFAVGSGNVASYDGRNLAEKHDVVLVTVNHRLNVFGFLYLEELFGSRYADSGNVGILDCAAALRWVRDNIANFGGNPGNVTIAGQSGGGAKVATLMAMPVAKGLFQRAIGQSGGMLRAISKKDASAGAKRFVDALGVKNIAELNAVPAERLLQVMDQSQLLDVTIPMLDGVVVPRQPFDQLASPLWRDIPLLVGTTETEATFFPNTPLEGVDEAKFHELAKNTLHANDADTDKLIAVFRHAYPGKDDTYLYQLLASQASFTQSTILSEAERKAEQGGAPVYVYYFVKHSPVRDGKLRAVHTLDIPYAFDSLARSAPIVGASTPEQQALADKMSSAWVSFARTGNPNNPLVPDWPPFDAKTRATMVIDDVWRVENDPLRETRLAIADLKASSVSPK